MLLNQLRLKARLSVPWKRNLDFALRSFELLSAAAIASIARAGLSPSMLGIPEMRFQFGLSTPLNNRFGQLLDQSSLCQHLPRVCTFLEQFVYQFGSNGHLFLLPSSSSSVLPFDHLHNLFYTLLQGEGTNKSYPPIGSIPMENSFMLPSLLKDSC